MALPFRATLSVAALLLVVAGCSQDRPPSGGDSEGDAGSESASTSSVTPEASTAPPSTSPTSEPESTMPDDTSATSPQGTSDGLPVGGASNEVRSRPSVQAAVQDLADRAETDVGNIIIVGYADVTWPDGSLGCPQPGRMYSQAVVPGQQLVLRVAEDPEVAATGPDVPTGLVSYHAGRRGTFTWCPNPAPPSPPRTGSD